MGKSKRRGIPLILIYSILTAVSFLLAGAVVIGTQLSRQGYENINRLTDGYLSCTKDILQLDETSDFLTERCREYVATGSKRSVESYVTEITESQNREHALEHFGTYFADTPVYTDLTEALSYSNQLAEREYYAMRLSADYYGFDHVPTRIQSVELTAVDDALTPEEKQAKALDMVFGSAYLDLKGKINAEAQSCLNGLIEVTAARKQAASDAITATMIFHDIAGGTLLALMVASAASTWYLAFRPLRKTREAIEGNKHIDVTGSSEIRFVESAYNHVYDENEHKKEILQFEVSHDILTGIPNRHDYVDTCNRFAHDSLIFIIADVDRFKSINDTCGHAIGDNALIEVARRLREAFLNHDRVFRIGGDEFVVMVFENSPARKSEIRSILEGINATLDSLHKHKKDFPEVSLSFGVAEKKANTSFEDVYRMADQALYHVKEKGGKDVAFDPDFFTK